MYITANGTTFTVKLENNSSAKALTELLQKGDITVKASDYGDFEKVGELPQSLPRNDEQITTGAGDIILYQGNKITFYYDTNSWNFTRLGRVEGYTAKQLKAVLGDGDVDLLLSLEIPAVPQKTNVLVAYFSCTGNTKKLAGYAADITGGTLYEIKPKIPYTEADLDYGDDGSRTSVEQNDGKARPEIKGKVDSIESYDIIFLAYPIWWGQAPKIIYTFLESYDLSGKTIVPFCTSGSSGIGSSAKNLRPSASGANWLDGARHSSSMSKSSMEKWIKGLGLDIET